jgi:hypothetical protein
MPTFSFPSSAATAATAAAAAMTECVPVPEPSKKPRDRKKASASAVTAPVAPVVVVADPVAAEPEEPEELEEPEEPEEPPTFPNMVILKQNDHNYIVKHNHYPITTAHSTDIPDLVSPNQIHKGQINKKRGRKPKAGFILNSGSGLYDTSEVPNIILHLKCHLSDLKTNESISNYEYTPAISEVESYTLTSNYLQSSDVCQPKNCDDDDDEDDDDNDDDDNDADHDSEHNITAAASASTVSLAASTSTSTSTTNSDLVNITTPATMNRNKSSIQSHANPVSVKRTEATDAAIQVHNQRNQKEIMKKINRLKYSFHNGEAIQTKINHKSACFWDTCDFDGPIYYIPIMIVNGVFQVNGCYCSPECAVAALLKEPLDTSTKFERLHLLHLLYGTSISKGFKPAPNPNYLLDKYYGNLTIHEYRALLKGPQMIHIVNKPLTHILPELYEDNNDFLVNSKVIPTNSLKMKKKYKTMVVQGSE